MSKKMSKLIVIATSTALLASYSGGAMNVLAAPITNANKTAIESKINEAKNATVSRFDLYGKSNLSAYNEVFKMENTNIKMITNNGGNYPGSPINKAIDGDMNTHWETGRQNTAQFTNEVVFNLNESTELNRIVYAARQSSAKGKGFAEEFEIYSSISDEGDDYTLVSPGQYKGSTGDVVEIQFKPTEFKRIKFVFKKANQDWASAAEFSFYKEDQVKDSMKKLFTDENHNKVSDEFNTVGKLEALEKSVQSHPLYDEFKEGIEDALVLINESNIEATKAKTKPFEHYSNEEYSKLFRMDIENIKSIRNNAGQYLSQVIGNAADGNLDTYWETNKSNSNDFTNEVEVEFKKSVELNRIMYGARKSDRKGFAEEFEIYASQTSKGDTYQLVTTGKHNMVEGLVEAKFDATKFKRVKFKFKKSNQNWATLSELAFYTEDAIEDKVNSIFTDGTMSKVVPEFNSVDKVNALENEAKAHPLYSILTERLDLAKSIVKGEVQVKGTIVEAEQRGDMVKHANQNLKFGFGNNLQPTGFAAQPGDKITVYVDADASAPLPKLSIAQQEGSFANWRRDVVLVPGKNEITVPQVNKDSWYKNDVTPGGSIYINNPYTKEQQVKAPKIRFEGAEKIPFATKNTNVAEFKSFLKEYKKKMDEDIVKHPKVEDRAVLDVFEFVSDHIVWTGTATGAYQTYIEQGYSPLETIESYNTHMEEIFRYYGLDASDESHDPKLIRDNVRLAQPYGYMYAYTDHIGVQGDVMANHLIPFEVRGPSWGLTHEIGHRMDVNARLYGETTNNMLPQYMSGYYGKLDNRIPYESNIYKNVIKENLKDYNDQGLFEKLGVYWQLEMYSPGYWGKLNRLYRERDVKLTDGESSKQQYLVEFSSEVLKLDLSEHFARHGFVVNEATRQKTAKYKKPKKSWYLNDSVVGYEGTGIEDKNASVKISITSNASAKSKTLSFKMDKKYKNDFLGYEIYRDGELVGFTSTDQFVDQRLDMDKNYTYKIIGYDKKLNSLKPVEVKAYQPTLSAEEHVTIKLRQKFDPMDYVKAATYQGDDITKDVVVKSNNVDVTKKGEYEIVYEVKNAGATETKTTKFTVASDFTFTSDMVAKSANIAWGGLKKDLAPAGGAITLVRQGLDATFSKGIGAHANSEVVYDIEGKGFDFFESYIGIDQAMKGKPSSATFEVWVDGEKKFDSDIFKADTEHEFVKVPITGAKEIKLVTTDAKNNGNSSDHTVWADAKFTQNSSKPTLTIPKSTATKVGESIDINSAYSAIDPEDGDLTNKVKVTGTDLVNFDRAGKYELTYTVTDSDGNEITKKRTISVVNMEDYHYLSNFDWKSTQNSYTAPRKDISISNNTLRLTGEDGSVKAYEKGIGAHSNSTIVYDLTDKDADYFTSFVGVDRQMFGSVGSVVFQVFVDGEKQFDSGLMNSRDPQKFIELNVSSAKELKLVVTDGGNGNGSDHATWGDAKLHFANAERLFTKNLEKAIEEAKEINKEDYTSESMELLNSTLTKAEEVLANKKSTQQEVDEAIASLKAAKKGLVEIDLTQVITIKDKYLSDSIKKTLGLTGDITLGDMYKLTTLTSESRRARSLEGLEQAKNLVTLNIEGNEITDFSPLKGLTKLEDLIADPQYVEVGEVKGSVIELDNLVSGIDGKKVKPHLVGVRNTKTFKETEIDVSEWEQNSDKLMIDISKEDKGIYMMTLAYKVEDNFVYLIYVIDNN
ncbi:NPCBM/NEW2 domain-containing protein [Viridibacillus arvi]|uniref:NPCBM/NEW2 domain-containing protein n=1 Tax=Viridibacillus arvi TaxID=263475 RepID=UPI0036CBF150